MRSNRLALVAVALGSALLGTTAAGVSAIAGELPGSGTAPALQPQVRPQVQHQRTRQHDGHGHAIDAGKAL